MYAAEEQSSPLNGFNDQHGNRTYVDGELEYSA
jgi:hypothetical protein